MIRIAICDDNKSTLVQLEKYIDNGFRQYTTDISISSFDNGQLLLTANNREKFDVLFLDIDMPKITGFDIAKSLRKSFSNCFLIFISSHSDLVYKSFDFQPFNFIRNTVNKIKPYYQNTPICVASKGIENETGLFAHEIIKEILNTKISVISGPSFAKDLAKENTALTIANSNETVLKVFQSLKIEKTNDIIGVEICGAFKNIIAISAGILNGLNKNESIINKNQPQSKIKRKLFNVIMKNLKLILFLV